MSNLPPEVLKNLWRVTPATFAASLSKEDPVPWVPAKHLLVVSKAIHNACIGAGPKFIIVCMPPRHGKPLDVKSLVLMGDGQRKALGDVQVGDSVITQKGRARQVTEVFEQGMLDTLRLTTASGRTVVSALDHPFLTTDGWKLAEDLRAGMFLAEVPGADCAPSVTNRRDEEYRLAGYFIGDGSVAQTQQNSFASGITCFDPQMAADLRFCAAALGFQVNEKRTGSFQFKSGVRDWLRETGIGGHTSYTKRVPEWVFRSGLHQIASFIGAYFACDGSITKRGLARKDACAEFYSVSKDLLGDVQHLLLRLGIQSTLCPKNGRYKGEVHKSWRLSITSRDDVAKFAACVPVVHSKYATLLNWKLNRTTFDAALFTDELVSIEAAEKSPCRCLTVEEDHTFTANDFVVHNSMFIDKWVPPWFLENWPHKHVMLCGYGADFAVNWGRAVRNIVGEHKDRLSFSLADDSKAANEWKTNRDGGMVTAGVGGSITGKGAHLLIIDDPIKNAEEANSLTYRNNIWDWWTSTARTRLEPGGVCVVIMTRWHDDDLVGRLLNPVWNEDYAAWKVIDLPAIWESDEPDLIGRTKGQALWPWRYDEEALAAIKRAVGLRDWASLFQQKPARTAGVGNVYHAYHDKDNVRRVERDVDMTLVWSLDFNVDPMSSIIGQYRETITPMTMLTNEKLVTFEVLQEMVLPNSNTREACSAFVDRTREYVQLARGRRVRLEIFGDVSGNQRSTNASETDWQIVKQFFRRYPEFAVTFNLPRDNPPVRDRTNAVNDALCSADRYRRLIIDVGCEGLRKDLREVMWKKDAGGNTTGNIDKSDVSISHLSDALGYAIWRKFGIRQVAGEKAGSVR